jgi:hypothetical protein
MVKGSRRTKMNSQKELMEALLSGKEISNKTHIVKLVDGQIMRQFPGDSSWTRNNYIFEYPEDWSIHTPPKEKKAYYQWVNNRDGIVLNYLCDEKGLCPKGYKSNLIDYTKFGEAIFLE